MTALNIGGGIFIGKSVLIGISDAGLQSYKNAINQILQIYCLYVVCTFILRLNVKLLQYNSIFKNFNVRWD